MLPFVVAAIAIAINAGAPVPALLSIGAFGFGASIIMILLGDRRSDSDIGTTKLIRMKNTINALIADIKTQTFTADMIILFGSIVRDDISEYSDMDICVVSDEDLAICYKREIENYFYDMAGDEFNLDFIYCDKDKLKNGKQVFENIRQEGRIIYERV